MTNCRRSKKADKNMYYKNLDIRIKRVKRDLIFHIHTKRHNVRTFGNISWFLLL